MSREAFPAKQKIRVTFCVRGGRGCSSDPPHPTPSRELSGDCKCKTNDITALVLMIYLLCSFETEDSFFCVLFDHCVCVCMLQR